MPFSYVPAARRAVVAAAVLSLAALTACSGGSERKAAAKPRKRATTTTTAAPTTTAPITTTTAKPTTTTTARPRPVLEGLGRGARGPQVLALQQRLNALHFDVGNLDGVYASVTAQAVMAFQKVYGLRRTGRATDDVVAKLATAQVPGPLVAGGGATKIEVDLPRQVLFLYHGGRLFKILPVSTGSGRRFCVDGSCGLAVTPGGSFRVGRRITGWRTSRLGQLYNPLYFNGGIAIHGASSVPSYPASHGCVRIPMSAAGWFPGEVPTGTPVYVVGGRRAAVPLNEPAPGDAPPSTTTTTRPPVTTTTTTTVPPTTTTTTTAPPTTTTTQPKP